MRQAGRGTAATLPPPIPPSGPEVEPFEPDAPPAATADAPPLDLDDVIIVWSEILPAFPPATKATAQEAQPIALDGDVITFGVPKNLIGSARERFKREADNIRAALTDRLGRRVMFKLEPIEGFGALPAPKPSGGLRSITITDEPPPPEDDIDDIDVAELRDVGPADAAVDSVGLLTAALDATVVEELPRD
jgi:hypothetical protein